MEHVSAVGGLVFFSSLGAGLLTISVMEKFGIGVNEGAVVAVLTAGTILALVAFLFFHPFFRSVLLGF